MRRTPGLPTLFRRLSGHLDTANNASSSTAAKGTAPAAVTVEKVLAVPEASIDCAEDEEYEDVFDFMAQQQRTTSPTAPRASPLTPQQKERKARQSIDKFLSSATLSLIEQQKQRASNAAASPASCGTHAKVTAETQEAAATAGEPPAPSQTARACNSDTSGPVNDASATIEAATKDPLSMRIDMDTEMLGAAVNSDEDDSVSSSPGVSAGCISWVKTPASLRKSGSQRGSLRNRPESLLFRQSGSSWFGGLLGGRESRSFLCLCGVVGCGLGMWQHRVEVIYFFPFASTSDVRKLSQLLQTAERCTFYKGLGQ
jgi:hypothetical protein